MNTGVGDEDSAESDPRLLFIYTYLTKSIRFKIEKWQKMMNTEIYKVLYISHTIDTLKQGELKIKSFATKKSYSKRCIFCRPHSKAQTLIMEFLENPQQHVLLITLTSAGTLIPSLTFPTSGKTKSSYFARVKQEPITDKNIRKILIFGDISPRPLEDLAVLVEEVFVPVFSNASNHKGWPAVVVEDVKKHVIDLKNSVYKVRGQINGQTLLPMPDGMSRVYQVEMQIIESNGVDVDLHFKSAIEGAVIKWVNQITEILHQTSSNIFKIKKNPLPYSEIEFWSTRVENLECIYDQLMDPRVKKMVSILELTDSAYYPSFRSIFRNIIAALKEAREISIYLKPLEKFLVKFDSIEFNEIDQNLRILLHLVCLIWAKCKYYCSSSKVITLLQVIVNLIIDLANRFLDPESLFQGEPQEMIVKVNEVINTMEKFKKSFEYNRDIVKTLFSEGVEPVPWLFHSRVVFHDLNAYLQRMKILYEIFDIAMEYSKLEKVEIGGLNGRQLSGKIAAIFDEFNIAFNVFKMISYNPSDQDDPTFLIDYKVFKEKVLDLDRRLAAVSSFAFNECHNLESIFKMINIWDITLKRTIIQNEITPRLNIIVKLLNDELDVVKELYEEQLATYNVNGYITVDKNWPPVAGGMVWILKMIGRISTPAENFKQFDNPIVTTPEAEYALVKYEELKELLQHLEEEIFLTWCEKIPSISLSNLSKTLLLVDVDTRQLTLNFDEELDAAIREMRYLKMIGQIDVPKEAQELFDQSEQLWKFTYNLGLIVNWYNKMRKDSKEEEFNLIEEEIKDIDDLIDEAQDLLNWMSSNAWDYIQSIRDKVNHLASRVLKAQTNLATIIASVNFWNNIPLFNRQNGIKENLLALDEASNKVTLRYLELYNTGIKICKLVSENFRLFFNITLRAPPLVQEIQDTIEDEIYVEPLLEPQEETEDVIDETHTSLDSPKGPEYRESKNGGELASKEIEKKSLRESDSPVSDQADKDTGKKVFKYAESKERKIEGKKVSDEAQQQVKKKSDSLMTKASGKKKREQEKEDKIESSFEKMSIELSKSEEVIQNIIDDEHKLSKWNAYLDMVDDEILDGLLRAVNCSLGLFVEEMNPEIDKSPLFEVSLELHDTDINFVPTLEIESDNPGCFYNVVRDLLEDIVHMAIRVPRISHNRQSFTYMDNIISSQDVSSMKHLTLERVKNATSKALEYSGTFEDYNYLWLDDRKEYLRQFLQYGHNLTSEEELLEGKVNEDGLPLLKENPPKLCQFKTQIDEYEELYNELSKIDDQKTFDKWLRVDNRPFKQALLNTVCKWGNMFKQHLVDHVINSLKELAQFIEDADKGLSKPLVEGDYEGLLSVMGYIMKVKDRMFETDNLFEPLKDVIELIKTYNMDFPEETYVLLQDLPSRWDYTKKVSAGVKVAALPLMQAEANTIRKRILLFEIRQNLYRDRFKNSPFFKWECLDVYKEINKAHLVVSDLEESIEKLVQQASLFEVIIPEFHIIKGLRKDLKMAKVLWDYILIVRFMISDWESTPWKKIESEVMDTELKKFNKEIKLLDKEMRVWDIYLQLEANIKNMITALRAVTQLQEPALRDRHWQQVMDAAKMTFVVDDKTTLGGLLALNLYTIEDEVKTIVDRSQKEEQFENKLKEYSSIWNAEEFQYEVHPRTGCKILKITENLVETLEENQMGLQNMVSDKFIAFFLDEVSELLKKLSNADQVIQIWKDVQKTWVHLESIFIGSEDIRKQLPEDSKRFDRIDKEFKALLEELVKTPNVVKATNRVGLYERLEIMKEELAKCEKALEDYLDTKKLLFPRFYFISNADLLDILSNGNQPELVCKHLSKLFDSISDLNFRKEGGKMLKKAKGMYAKDGEYVEFKIDCDCNGQVEIWLSNVLNSMRSTLRHYFGEAVVTYDDKPREQWLFEYPAQCALCGTQIWWTTEVNMAFARLEEGYENALRDYQKKQVNQLSNLINILLGDLSEEDRQKVETICTIDVHSRDVVKKMIDMKIESSSAFQWQSQLRHRWDDKLSDCYANICDANFHYSYEYLGNTPRLVITPLTDRCYITLSQSLHLIMGGAPAGPAGTGKTETTKDLGRAIGVLVYVTNCSEQMDYKTCGNIFKGLAQNGAWGCFDEFNRISVEVLSVVAVQVKSVLDAIKAKKVKFNFQSELISLDPKVGMFITMNPGYAGRAELPENLKALFRPCAMVVPDFVLICEIILVSKGFQDAKVLGQKFVTLYKLCKELLSKQDHYDWGLRAFKSVLVVAGKLKRDDKQRPENQVLMRALRDFNLPKIVIADEKIFNGLISDLFPALDVPRKRDFEFEKQVRQAAINIKLQPEENFILKVVQLQEILDVRHSVFIIGDPGTGKSQVWKTLFRTYFDLKRKPFYNDLEPKAVTNDELFGVINPATREWKDGLFSVLIREQANLGGDGPKWMVLDGDIDPMWIESLNTVMDDNKILTLASNERIALTPSMRLVFEISNLRVATPATVSRAGVLYITPQDVGWNPFVTSWIDQRENENEKAILIVLFDKYIPPVLEASHTKYQKVTPIPDIAHIQMLCVLLESMLIPSNVPLDCPKEWYEIYFVFACVWAFGSCTVQDQLVDWRAEFSKWWCNEFKAIKFPIGGLVFNYYIDQETKRFLPWTDKVPKFELDIDVPLQATLVSTAETTRVRYFLDLLLERRKPVMLVGGAGSGKSVLINDKLNSLPDNFAVTNVPFNFYTTSEMLQKVLEKPLEKRSGRNYGPAGNKIMIYFLDDMNMPEVDKYGTVQPHTLVRQWMDYQHWYDRTKLTLKDIHDITFFSCMNPKAGSFTIDPRLQRHFSVFALSFPGYEALFQIFNNILSQFLSGHTIKFPAAVVKMSDLITELTLTLHSKMSSVFLPTAVKFHYIFSLRDLANIYQGMLFCTNECLSTPGRFLRLWMHESSRVYCDKLIEYKDQDTFSKLMIENVKKIFAEMPESEYNQKPLIFCHFVDGLGDPKYLPMPSWTALSKMLQEAMSQYNDLVGAMNLVLFEDAMCHVCRINRIMEAPRGNALLVGVGGSGKQSLSRLSAYISNLEPFQIQLKRGYGIADLKRDLANQYTKAGLKNISIMFLMSDAQVPEERFLVLINDMLASGEIPELFADDEVDNIISSISTEVKSAGLPDTKEVCWKYFINKVRKLIKVILCFSPVGSTLRIRARQFPSIVNCTSIDWFMEWPQEALQSVSHRFLTEIEALPTRIRKSVSLFMSHVHTSVNTISKAYFEIEHRYNYTTPKTFLEQINLYSKLLEISLNDNKKKTARLRNGLTKLVGCSDQVKGLQMQLAIKEKEVQEKVTASNLVMMTVCSKEENVKKEKAIAEDEEKKVKLKEDETRAQHHRAQEEVANMDPYVKEAESALDTLNKNNLTELKSFGSPPTAVVKICEGVLVLFCKGKLPKDRSWKTIKVMMGALDKFLTSLKEYKKKDIHPDIIKEIKTKYLNDPEFVPEVVMVKSSAAAGLCRWVINIIKYNDLWQKVIPLLDKLEKAEKDLEEAKADLRKVKERLEVLTQELEEVQRKFNIAKSDMEEAKREQKKCQDTIDLANRLVSGLASENTRWKDTIDNLDKQAQTLPGDMLLVTAFISYVGCFTRNYRYELMNKHWLPYIGKLKPEIAMSNNVDPLELLTDEAKIAEWQNHGLPSDRMSAENATILVNSDRWPLIIDPQLQGIKWIKSTYSGVLDVVRLGQKNFIDRIERSCTQGSNILIENIGESIDPVLDNLLGRNLIKKGRAVKIGDKEVDFNPKFRLILHTKLANPHYKPEIQAQATLINFTVTKDGLEEQLLAEVVKAERPDLESKKAELTKQQNEFKIELKRLEDDLLMRLASAGPNILEDRELVLNLEQTKKTADEVTYKVVEAKSTSAKIDEAREMYRPAATRASIIYFILNDLNKINLIYQFSLKAFTVVFQNAIAKADPAESVQLRVVNLVDFITFFVFMYTCRGLFENDKLIFVTQLAIQVLLASKEILPEELDFLLRFPFVPNLTSPVDFLTNQLWGGIKALSNMDAFRNLDKDIEGSQKRWKKFIEGESPEREKFPQDWKNKSALQRLCMMRSMRPDRMTYAVRCFIEEKLGSKFVEARTVEFSKSFEETSATVPVFFILSPGVDPTRDVESVGKKMGFTIDKRNFHNVSLGQGQEPVAERLMDVASRSGHWVILQNIHLVKNWLPSLEKKMESCSQNPHPDYRLFISGEPAPCREFHIIPQGVLESSIKITNEPPTGMLANLHKALDNFTQDSLEQCSKEAEFKVILFSLCYFHAVVNERRKFGAQGWNRSYPFNVGDLTISSNVLFNYLENSSRIPWEDLRYLFGEIMYGGHITDDWDRRLCRDYLLEYLSPELVEGELFYAPGFQAPPNMDYVGYHNYIDDMLPPESPVLYGLHPNAEIGFLTTLAETLFQTIFELQPREAGAAAAGGVSRDDKVKQTLDEIADKVPDPFNIADLAARVEDITPFINVAFQECDRMNNLMKEIRISLKELSLGLKGELTITSQMERLEESLFMDKVPDSWTKLAYPSLLGLGAWFADLMVRLRELENWIGDFNLPSSVWLAGFFNPQAFLTAIMQTTARKNEWPLDKMCLQCDVTKKQREEFTSAPREGAYINGLFLEGARWDIELACIAPSKLKELFPMMPVVFVKAVTQDKQDVRNIYECPVYMTRQRGPTYVSTFNLKTKEKPAKWTLAGVAIILCI